MMAQTEFNPGLSSDELEREMYRQDLIESKYGKSPAMECLPQIRMAMGIDLSSKIDQTILTAFNVDGYTDFTGPASTSIKVEEGTVLTVDMVTRAMEILSRNHIPLRDHIWNDVYEDEMPAERPAFATQFSSMDKYPQYIEGPAGMTATLLSDDQEVFDESATMRHCLWRFYTMKIQRGEFIAYHIDTPNLFKHGFTCCFHAVTENFRDYEKDTRVTRRRWLIDQIRGKANSVSADPDLLAFAETILHSINGV